MVAFVVSSCVCSVFVFCVLPVAVVNDACFVD